MALIVHSSGSGAHGKGSGAGPVDNSASPQSRLRTLPYGAARIEGGFWAATQATNRDVSLPHGYQMLLDTGTLHNLELAAQARQTAVARGGFKGFWFADSDVYKWLEAAAWELGRAPDATLQAMVDNAIAVVEAAQEADGYLDSWFQVEKPAEKWTDLDHGHELYCAGHLIQAAIAFQRALDDARLLTVAQRLVDHIDREMGAQGRDLTCGHPEIEMALVELYRITHNPRDLELAQLFIDRRGRNRMRGHAGYGAVYQQDHVPVREAKEVAGHAVRQLYLTTGVTDLYMETGEAALLAAMHTLWADMTARKMYITGALGSRFDGEAFGGPYELPPDIVYGETCAAIASLMWNWRLLLVTGESRYADLFERALYNGVLCSPGLAGDSYLYVNPLQVRSGRYVRASADTGTGDALMRPHWHNCACCPPNVMRLFASLSHYLATSDGTGVQIHQYADASLGLQLHDAPVQFAMRTDYPWDGAITLHVNETSATQWTLSLRVPAWCRQWTVSINGAPVEVEAVDKGYLRLTRVWAAGDRVDLSLVMAPYYVASHPRVDAVRGCVAIQSGPLVYCFESDDQPADVDLQDVRLDTDEPLRAVNVQPVASPQLRGMVALQAKAISVRPHTSWQDTLFLPLDEIARVDTVDVTLTAIPYFAWGNRGMHSMRVWVPEL